MKFYVRADDHTRQIGPLSFRAAQSILRATAMAQRSGGSRVWGDGFGRLYIEETGCAPATLWIADELDHLVNLDFMDLVTEPSASRQPIFLRIKQRIEAAVRR